MDMLWDLEDGRTIVATESFALEHYPSAILSQRNDEFVFERLITQARRKRDKILANVVDPLVLNPMRWADLTAEKQAEWAAYRRALLDVPQQEGFPADITWPTQPEA